MATSGVANTSATNKEYSRVLTERRGVDRCSSRCCLWENRSSLCWIRFGSPADRDRIGGDRFTQDVNGAVVNQTRANGSDVFLPSVCNIVDRVLRFSDLHGVCGGSPIAACFVLRDEKWNWLNIYRAFSNGPIGGVEPPLEPSPLKKSQAIHRHSMLYSCEVKKGSQSAR